MRTITIQIDDIETDTTYWDEHAKASKPFIVDDNGCSRDIDKMLRDKKIEEIVLLCKN